MSQKEKKSKSIESSNKPPYDDVDYQEFDDNYLQEYYDEQDVVPEYGNYIKLGQNHFYYVMTTTNKTRRSRLKGTVCFTVTTI